MAAVRSTGRSKLRLRRAAVVMAAVAAVGTGTTAQAGSYYWAGDNAANGTAWNATSGLGATNWSSSPDFNQSILTLPGAADDVFFYLQPLNLSTTLGQDFSIKSLTFLGGTSGSPTSDVSISGANTLTVNAGGINVQQFSGNDTLNAAVTLGATQTWTHNGSNPLTFNGVVGGAAANNLTLAGTGNVTFTAANTYAGTTNLSTNLVTLNLSGAGTILNSTALTLNGGSVLNLDNTTTNVTNRVADTTPISSLGGTINLKGAAATETLGTLTLTTGAARINVDPGSKLTISGIVRNTGGTINFSPTGTTNLPSISNTNSIIGGHATIGNIGGVQQDAAGNANVLDFAAVDGSKNVIPLATYAINDFSAAANNTKVDGTASGGLVTLSANSTINSLYMTGGARVQVGATTGTTTTTLVVGSGGIISNAATLTLGGSGPQIDLANSAVLGSGVVSANGAAGGAITGIVTTGTSASLTNDLVVTTASNLRIDSVIANNGTTVVSLVKNGSGTLDISDGNGTAVTNTYSGTTTVNGGLLTIKGDLNLGAVPAANTANSITLNGGELRMYATITLNSKRGITVGPQGGTISYNGGNTTHLTGFLVTGTGSVQYSDIPGFGNVSANQCGMDIGFTTTNYQGATTFFTQGSTNANPIVAVIFFSGNDKVPDTSPVTVTTVAGSGGSKGVLNMFGKSDTWGSLAGNGDIVNGVATTSNLTVGGNNLSTTYSGRLGTPGLTWAVGAGTNHGADIVNASTTDTGTSTSSAITLTKNGSGIMTMSGANGYTGATTINGGMLNVTGSLANTTVTVNSGSLGGTGSIAGPVIVTSTGHLSPSASSSTTSTLSLGGNLTVGGGANFDFNFGASGTPGTGDTVNVTGTALLNAGPDTVNITALPGFGIGTYTLITAGTLTDNVPAASWVINGSSLFNYSVSQSGNTLVLNVIAGTPTLTWIGNVSNVWQAGGPTNWNNGSGATAFTTGFNVELDDNGIGTPTIAVDAGGVSVNNMDLGNATGTYTLNGGAITIASKLTKSGTGSATFNNSVSAPLTVLSNGTINIGATGTLSSTSLQVSSTGTLTVASGGSLGAGTTGLTVNGAVTLNNASQTITGLADTGSATTGVLTLNGTALTISGASAFDGRITGSGSVAITGATTLSNGTNNYTGGTTVTGSGGVLNVTNTTGSATGAGAVTIGTLNASGAGPTLSGNGIITGPITIHTNGTLAGTGTFGSSVALNGTIAPAGVGTVGAVTTGALTAASGATLKYDLGAVGPGTTSDTANITGALSLSGTQNINVSQLAGFGTGTYVLMTSTGTFTSTATYNVTGITLPRSSFSVTADPTAKTLSLTVTLTSLKWTGAIDNVWDIDNSPTTPGTANWADSTATFNTYLDTSPVTFDDTGANTNPITIPANVAPSVMTFNNSTATTYTIGNTGDTGVITGAASVVKNGTGTVVFTNANTFTGGITINGGSVQLANATAGGTGPITVNTGGKLALGTGAAAALPATTTLTLAGGQVGAIANFAWTLPGNMVAAAGTTSIVSLNDQSTGLGRNGAADIILTGALSGSGNLIVQDVDPATTGPDSNGFRLRGTGASSFSGTITLSQRAKFELQTTVASFSPAGTGKIIMTGGTIAANNTGSFSIMNLRDNSAGDTTFGNDLQVTGTGSVLVNLLGSAGAGTAIGMGNLTIGGGQTLAAVATSGNAIHTLTFNNVSLTGGDATLSAGIPGNTSYIIAHNISVGAITETVAGSGIVVNGTGNLVLRNANTYTGNTTVTAGTLVAGVVGALPSTTNLISNGGTVDLNNAGTSASQTVASLATLAGAGGIITNSDATNARTLTVNQSTSTTFTGSITGNIGLTKSGTGMLALTGTTPSTYTGPTTITGGTLRVNGVLSATAVVVQAGRLDGTGDGVATGSITQSVTIGNGALTGGVRDATLAPGNSVGTIGTGALSFASDGIYAVEVDSTASTADRTITTGTVSISGAAISITDLGSTKLPLNTKFNIITNGSTSAVTGAFAGMPEGGIVTAGLNNYQITYLDNADSGPLGNDVTLTTVSAPEPAGLGLIGFAAAGLLARRRRRLQNR